MHEADSDAAASSPPEGGTPDTPGVLAPPPVIYAAAWIAGLLLHRRIPLRLLPGGRAIRWTIAAPFLAGGFALSAAVVRTFHSAGTPVSPLRAPRALATNGPYRVSRNPDYIGQLLMYLGGTAAVNSWWPVALLPPAVATIHFGVVRREERFLERTFGQQYTDYAARVPRWL